MKDFEDRNGYWIARHLGRAGKTIRNKASRFAGVDWVEDEDGKKHFFRRWPAETPPPVVIPPPDVPPVLSGDFLYSEPDYISRNDMNHPQTRKCLTEIYVNAEGFWGDYILRVMHLLHPNVDKWRFNSWFSNLFNGKRAFDNGHAYGSGDWAIANLYCGGATFRKVDNVVAKKGRYGYKHMKVHAINPKRRIPLPTKLSDIDPLLHFWATTGRATGSGPFPQFDGRIMLPFFAADYDSESGISYNWVSIDGDPINNRPGRMVDTNVVRNPFTPPLPQLTIGVLNS